MAFFNIEMLMFF